MADAPELRRLSQRAMRLIERYNETSFDEPPATRDLPPNVAAIENPARVTQAV
ncbi:MAG TPA: maltose acetyltransferase domain-containing protein [Polyangiaceae bacterium]|nr:maltose acetyltransferase domain-containing protein [Polyangiaceae bacterium]